jgi:DNA-binding transcriptional LysR family regulator
MSYDSKKSEETARSEKISQLRKIDLNLFLIFEAILQQGSVTKAAKVLSITPSAVSHALGRVRQMIGDELFVPSGSGMQPTRRARQLALDIQQGLQNFHLALMEKTFVPAEADRSFRIAASDGITALVLPALLQRLVKSAPNVDLRVFPSNRIDVVRQLEADHLDLIIGWFGRLPDGMCRRTLYREQEAIVVRAGHPLTHGKVTKERLFKFPHAVVDLTGTEENERVGFMSEHGVERRVWFERTLLEFQDEEVHFVGRAAVCVPHFAAVAPLLEVTDMVAKLPHRLAIWLTAHTNIVLLELPYSPVTADVEMVWHQRANRDTGLQNDDHRMGSHHIDHNIAFKLG